MAEKKRIETSDEARERERARALAFELRQIIQADRMAMDVISNAEATRKEIERKTGEEAEEIRAEAQNQLQEATRRAEQAHAGELEERKREAEQSFARQRRELEQRFAEGRSAWAQQIAAAILADENPGDGEGGAP